jgi:hypothetical protein
MILLAIPWMGAVQRVLHRVHDPSSQIAWAKWPRTRDLKFQGVVLVLVQAGEREYGHLE